MNAHLTMVSGNAKTGPIPVSTTTAKTCPTSCPFNNANAGGCYASGGPLAIHWRAVTNGQRGTSWDAFLQDVKRIPKGSLWRHNQAGDLPGEGDVIDGEALAALTAAQRGRRGFTYTHKPMTAANAAAVQAANAAGFTVNLSANNLRHADELAALGIAPVVAVVPEDHPKVSKTEAGRTVFVCPAQERDDMNCARCGLCATNRNGAIVAFRVHGASKKRAIAATLAA